jgi:capsular exopolysaccharide synthesis family protein
MSDLTQPPADLSLPPRPGNAVAVRPSYPLQLGTGSAEPGAEPSLALADLLRIVFKHKWTLLLVVLLAGSVAVVRTLLTTPTYRSTATLQIERAAPRVVSFNNDLDQPQSWSDDANSMRTHAELLRSRSLAERVVDELRLDQSRPASGTGTSFGSLATSTSTTAAAEGADPPAVDASQGLAARIAAGYRKLHTPATRDAEVLGKEAVLGGFLGSLSVEPVPNSRLLKLHVDNANPELAARMANATVQSFIAMGLERRVAASSYTKSFLEDQIKQIKAKLEDSERKLNRYAQDKQILTLDEKTSVISQTYTDYASAYAKAEQDRIKAEALYAEVKRNPDSMQQVLENKTVQSYKDQRAKLEVEYQQNLRIYKPDFPKMLQIKAQIGEVEAQIRTEVAAVTASIASQFEAAQRHESMLRDRLGQTRKQVLQTQDGSIDLNLLKREVDTNRQLYDGLLQRLKQVGVSGEVVTNSVAVIDPAEPALFPYKPDLRRNLLLGIAAGVFLGLCLVFLLEYLDDSIKTPNEVESQLGVALMGIVPFAGSRRAARNSIALDVHADPRSTMAEAYRSLRTALQFSTSEGAPTRLVVTSSTRSEGKSTTALALAISFAQLGQKVLLIDADMRNPSVHEYLGIPNDEGLSNLLSSASRGDALIKSTQVPNLLVLTAGPVPPNPVDLLMGPRMASLLEKTQQMGIDYVLVDAPPILGIADAIVLGNQIQNILFVVRAGRTRRADIRDALRRLRLAGLGPRGVVLTHTNRKSMPDDSYYGYGDTSGPAKPHPVGTALRGTAG